MSRLSSDTYPKMEALQIQLWRQASPTRKMHALAQLNASARMLAMTGLRSRFPNASEAELRFKLAGLLLGDELARKVYGEISQRLEGRVGVEVKGENDDRKKCTAMGRSQRNDG